MQAAFEKEMQHSGAHSQVVLKDADVSDEVTQRKIDKLIDLVKGKSARSLRAFLDSELNKLDLMSIRDEKGYSLLHLAAFKRFSNDFEQIIVSYVRQQAEGDSRERIIDYVNAYTDNDDGYTALHFAAYYGNFVGIKFLISEGADPQIRSK